MRLPTVVLLTLLVLPATADAASVGAKKGGSGHVVLNAASGEVNDLTIRQTADVVTLTEAALPLTADVGCTQVSAQEVSCSMTKADKNLELFLGDQTDRLTIDAAVVVPVKVDCGGAPDTFAGKEPAERSNCELPPVAPTPTPDTPPAPVGPDGLPTDVAAPFAAPPAPEPGRSVGVGVKAGLILVKAPGAAGYTPLVPGKPVPVGATLDASRGTLSLVAAKDTVGGTQTADFTGGRFVVNQKRAAVMTTELVLSGPLPTCAPRTTARAAAVAKKPRRLWGSGHGRFTTRGRNSAATVRGTIWSVTDTCRGTLTKVERGVVVVEDFARRRTVVVKKGQQYLAKKRPAAAARRR